MGGGGGGSGREGRRDRELGGGGGVIFSCCAEVVFSLFSFLKIRVGFRMYLSHATRLSNSTALTVNH